MSLLEGGLFLRQVNEIATRSWEKSVEANKGNGSDSQDKIVSFEPYKGLKVWVAGRIVRKTPDSIVIEIVRAEPESDFLKPGREVGLPIGYPTTPFYLR